jgi:hypothetical protein
MARRFAVLLILDSSVLVGRHWHFDAGAAKALLSACSSGRARVAIPEVVVREVATKQAEQEAVALQSIQRTARNLSALRGEEVDVVVPQAPGDYETALREALRSSRVRILPLPTDDHQSFLDRALNRRKPFDGKGRAGYRDALIWASVLERAGSEQVLFATANRRDFSDPAVPEAIHQDLRQDLLDRGLDEHQVRLCQSLDAAAEILLESSEEVVRLLAQRLSEDDEFRNELEATLNSLAWADAYAADDTGVHIEIESRFDGLDLDIMDADLEQLEGLGSPSVREAWRLDQDKFAVLLEASAIAIYRVEVSAASFWRRPDRLPRELDVEQDDRSVWVGGFAEVQAFFNGTYDRTRDDLTDPEVAYLVSD